MNWPKKAARENLPLPISPGFHDRRNYRKPSPLQEERDVNTTAQGFSDDERAAMKERARQLEGIASKQAARCPCLSGLPYSECCEPLLAGASPAPTAERLMRSRFSAFAVGDASYLLATWHPSTRPAGLTLDDTLRWTRLDILGRSRGGMLDNEGTVEFTAHFRSPDGPGSQRENSRFVRESGAWVYLDGTVE